MNCSLFLKNLEKHFCDLTYKKNSSTIEKHFCDTKYNFVKHIENLPQHLSEKFIGDNLLITDIVLRNWDLSIIGIAQSIFEIIDYRYRFSIGRFIVRITATRTINLALVETLNITSLRIFAWWKSLLFFKTQYHEQIFQGMIDKSWLWLKTSYSKLGS